MSRPGSMVVVSCLLIVSVLGTSCVGSPDRVAEARSTTPRVTEPGVAPGAVTGVAGGISAFGLDLYRTLAQDERGNLFFSPYSLSTALGMVYAGAKNETERQMAETLHWIVPQEPLHLALNALDLSLTKPTQPFTLTTANAAWAQEGYRFRPTYLDTLAMHYGAGVGLVDFKADAGREAALRQINAWAKARTNGKIPELVSPDLVNQDTRLVLANAVYFKADWLRPFHPSQTEPMPFKRADGSEVPVPMMRQRGGIAYFDGPGYQAVELSYAGERMRMLAILPDEGTLAEFERSLDSVRLAEIVDGLETQDIALYLPKFKFETRYLFEKHLPEMGMPDLFDAGRADLSGMSEAGEVRLFIAHVVQKAYVAVDEKGTEAAAATAAIAEAVSAPPSVLFNRPFVFLIGDAETGTILFLGRLADPAVT